VYRTLEKVLDGDTTVLIEGEGGSGKDGLAQWLHFNSTRRHGPLIKIDLASLPEELVESELFGYERGAFTGAAATKLGKLDLGQAGSIILDEIANVDLRIQAKLLNVVETKEYYRLGGTKSTRLDTRLIAITSIPLTDAVQRKTFREDLFFRLNLITVRVPPLRERRGDIFPIAQFLLGQLCRKHNLSRDLDGSCRSILEHYEFPGNLRELKNGLERALLIASQDRILPDDLPRTWSSGASSIKKGLMTLEDVEREHIENVLKQLRGQKVEAAKVLGISRKTLLEKRKKYGLP
jgi:transcriptional regulator with PAS, ATPase and Fis domain